MKRIKQALPELRLETEFNQLQVQNINAKKALFWHNQLMDSIYAEIVEASVIVLNITGKKKEDYEAKLREKIYTEAPKEQTKMTVW